MRELIKISAVSYLNSLPFIFGIKNYKQLRNFDIKLSEDMPSLCARKLQTGEVDLGLIPVAAVPAVPKAEIIGNFCIGASGQVDTVLLLSDVPLSEINTVLLDYQSRTSVALVRVLARNLWKISPEFVNAQVGFEKLIKGTTAGVVIGDRTFDLLRAYSHVYDLSAEWQKMTTLPFVFATWTSNKSLPDAFVNTFNDACAFGLENINTIIENFRAENPGSQIPLLDYFTNKISYSLDTEKRQAMNLFWSYLKETETTIIN